MEQIDPHHRTDAVINACLQHPNALGLNELHDLTGIHKETLYSILEQEHIFDVDKKNGKWKIRLKEMVETEDQIFTMLTTYFQSYLDAFPKKTRTVQIESVVHFLQLISAMQMIVFLNFLNTNTSFVTTQQIIKNQLENFQDIMGKAFSKIDKKTRLRYATLINQEVNVIAQRLAAKAEDGIRNVEMRTKFRTLEDLLFDSDQTIPNDLFIPKTIRLAENAAKQRGLTSKQGINSLPLKYKQTETKYFKEFNQLQYQMFAKEKEHFGDFGMDKLKQLLRRDSDEHFDQKLLQVEKELAVQLPMFPPSQRKLVLKFFKDIRFAVKNGTTEEVDDLLSDTNKKRA